VVGSTPPRYAAFFQTAVTNFAAYLVFAVRIRIYKEEGYFPSKDADRLTTLCRHADVHVPEQILNNFIAAYRHG
jgi:hypothetical protein